MRSVSPPMLGPHFRPDTVLFCIGLALMSSLCQSQTAPFATDKQIQQRLLHTVHDEFVGPFPSWMNVQRDFGAKGDGNTDDTAALQAGLDAINKDNAPAVLYLPAGVYRITKTLTMVSHFGRSVIGEDPLRTVIRWDGPVGGTMLFRNGTRWGSMARLTWDGQNRARTGVHQIWDGMVPNYATYNQHADEIFKDCDFGLRIGQPHTGDAECAVLRCQFLRCKRAGLSVNSFNSLDIWAWNCLFDSCGIGASNQSFTDPAFYASNPSQRGADKEGGAGHFHAYQCLFRSSRVADMTIMHTSDYFGIRQNVSIGSKAFFLALAHPLWGKEYSFTVPVLLQGNLVLDTQDTTPVRFSIPGNAVLMDNIIQPHDTGKATPVVEMAAQVEGSLVSIGNAFPTQGAVQVKGHIFTLDDRILALVPLRALPEMMTWQPPVEKAPKRKVFEIAPGSNSATIQAAIDEAAKLQGSRPIVHLPHGQYLLEKTLVVPAGSDVQIVGDGGLTQLRWNGGENGPVLLLRGPSHATLKEFELWGASKPGPGLVEGIVIEDSDRANGRIFGEQLLLNGDTGLLVNGLDKTMVMLFDSQPGSGEKGTALKVIGGPEAAQGRAVPGFTYLWGGGTSNNKRTYDLRQNATLLVRDTWYEGSVSDRFIEFTRENSGTFVLDGSKIAVQPIREGRVQPLEKPSVMVNGFRGKAVFIGATMSADNRFGASGDAETNLLLMGILGGTRTPILETDGYAKATVLASRDFFAQPAMRTAVAPNVGQAEPAWVRTLLEPARREWPRSLAPLAKGVPDVRIFRVIVSYTRIGLHISR